MEVENTNPDACLRAGEKVWVKYFILWEKVLPGRIRFTKNWSKRCPNFIQSFHIQHVQCVRVRRTEWNISLSIRNDLMRWWTRRKSSSFVLTIQSVESGLILQQMMDRLNCGSMIILWSEQLSHIMHWKNILVMMLWFHYI